MQSYLVALILSLLIFCARNANGQCGDVYEMGVSDSEKATILSRHNEIRYLIMNGSVPGQPQGVGLKIMVWDDTIAAAAQDIANTCIFAHQQVPDDRWYVGQNLYLSASTGNSAGSSWVNGINAWYNEYSTYTYSNRVYNHYTQLVWDTTEYVGCGYIFYKKPDPGASYPYTKYYVCNYGPGGNMVGRYPYQLL